LLAGGEVEHEVILRAACGVPRAASCSAAGEFQFSLQAALKREPVVLYFFVLAFTPACTTGSHEFAALLLLHRNESRRARLEYDGGAEEVEARAQQ
jgi:hypothetical protein